MKRQYYRNVKDIKDQLKDQIMLKEIEEQKRKEQEEQREKEEEEKLQSEKKSKNNQISQSTKESTEGSQNVINLSFDLTRNKLIRKYVDNPNHNLNNICKDLNDDTKLLNLGNVPEIKSSKESEAKTKENVDAVMRPPNSSGKALNRETIDEIKRKADTSKLYIDAPSNYSTFKKDHTDFIISESHQFLDSINFCDFNEKGDGDDNDDEHQDKIMRFDTSKGISSPQQRHHKDDHDDLFGSHTPNKEKDAHDDDLFADSPKANIKKNYDDDVFGNGDVKQEEIKKRGEDRHNDDVFGSESDDKNKDDSDDPFAEPEEKQPVQTPKVTEQKDAIESGDFFLKEFNQKASQDEKSRNELQRSFTYFGELKNARSCYADRYTNHHKIQTLKEPRNTLTFEITPDNHDVIKMQEKAKPEDLKNKNLAESKIFDRLSLYKFRNKALEDEFKLGKLVVENKVNTKLMVLETDKKRREAKFDFQENINNQMLKSNRLKYHGRSSANFNAFGGQNNLQGDNEEAQLNENQDKVMQDVDDLEDISSIDSDTREEEKYRSVGNVFSGNQEAMKAAASDMIEHAKCYVLEWLDSDFDNFHRPDLGNIISELRKDNEIIQKADSLTTEQKLRMSNAGSLKELQKKEKEKILSLKVVLQSKTKLKTKQKKSGIINANDFFKDRYKLSLKTGKFLVFEHLDKHPLFINDFGMASKLYRYVYSDRMLPLKSFKVQPSGMAHTRHMGYYGQQVLLKDDDKLPLIGELDRTKYQGVSIIDTNLYRAPVCYHKPKMTDFLCVVHRDRKGEKHMYLREMKQIYTFGQIEPKDEVYAPGSRAYNLYLKKKVQAFSLKILHQYGDRMSFYDLRRYFMFFNDQVLKKAFREVDIDIDRNQDAVLKRGTLVEDKIKTLISPENVCQYESSEFAKRRLEKLGIRSITHANRISFATNKFCAEIAQFHFQHYARLIEEEMLSTPWHLSQSFLANKDTNMMKLIGIGDPSNGYGGYSYLKMPLKASQDNLNKNQEKLPQNKSVTGTEADLRKLSKHQINEMLRALGFDKEHNIENLQRWERVKLLRDQSSKAASLGVAGNFKIFARGIRQTAKMHKENYQRDVNELFARQMKVISDHKPDLPSESD